jgi:DNA-binding transcriptional MerR regulator
MRIGEIAEKTGLSASRIRFYEASGLIASVREPNGYRSYGTAVVEELKQIDAVQKLGFSLEEISQMAAIIRQCRSGRDDGGRGRVLAALQAKLVELETMQRRLAESKGTLQALIGEVQAGEGNDCTVQTQKAGGKRSARRGLSSGRTSNRVGLAT